MTNQASWYDVIQNDIDLTQHWAVLGLKPGSATEEVEAKFRALTKELRTQLPKVDPKDRDELIKQMSAVEHAFAVVSNCLEQGDILFNCPVPSVLDLDVASLLQKKEPTKKPRIGVDAHTVVILSQSCDLLNAKIENVVVAQVVDWKSASIAGYKDGNTSIISKDARKKIGEGHVPSLSLLYKHSDVPKLDWSVVDFHKLYVLPKYLLQQVANSSGHRLRLRSPYKEYLAQAFARYFMRVGLPLSADLFELEGALDTQTEKDLRAGKL